MSGAERKIPDVLSCVLFVDNESNKWVAHCLDFDLATSGRDEDAAWKNLKTVVRVHVENCFTHWPDALKKRASEEEWQQFNALKLEQREFRSEKITFNLVPPKTSEMKPLWMHGFEAGEFHGTETRALSQVH